ncbi:MAG: response regulator [Candidatus Hydrogenedentota bacterium]
MKRILFVDDDKSALDSLRVMFHGMRETWDLAFVSNARAAMELMGKTGAFDAVVTELRLPGESGADFLRQVMMEFPLTVRLVLAANLNREAISECAPIAHQMLMKPCESQRLRGAVGRALSLQDRFSGTFLKTTLMNIGSLPSVPVVYTEIVQEMQREDFSIEKIGRIMERDAGMSAKVLQIVNSAHFGLRHEVSNIVHACALLGLDNIRAFVLFARLISDIEGHKLPKGFSLNALWNHGLVVGGYAKRIAQHENATRKVVDNAYTAGLLHDIGLLILASQLPEKLADIFARAKAENKTVVDAEKLEIGASHADIGGYLLDLWGLPTPIVTGITYHFYPSTRPEAVYLDEEEAEFEALTAVHVANYFCEEQDASPDELITPIDMNYLEEIGLGDRVGSWYDACFKAK